MTTVAEAIAALAQVHQVYEAPDADQRTAAYWWGKQDESVAWWLSLCKRVAADPIAQSLYLASVAEDLSHKRDVKDWAYRIAAEIAITPRYGSQRNQPAVASYHPRWGRQAARDGVALALWPHLAEYVPGRNARAAELGCRDHAYQYIRDGVRARAIELVTMFRDDMEQCRSGRYRRDFMERWEATTG